MFFLCSERDQDLLSFCSSSSTTVLLSEFLFELIPPVLSAFPGLVGNVWEWVHWRQVIVPREPLGFMVTFGTSYDGCRGVKRATRGLQGYKSVCRAAQEGVVPEGLG